MRVTAAALALAVVALAGSCGTGDQTTTDAPDDARVSCGPGGQGFPAEALDGPTGAEESDTPEAAGLRSLIENPDGIGELPRTDWRLLDRDDDHVTFGAESVDGLTVVSLRREGDRWKFSGSAHGCPDLMVVPPEGLSAAVWWRDPDADDSGDDRVLHVFATDPNCASGRPTGDRLRPPTLETTDDEVVITFTAEPVTGDQSCPGHPPTPYQVQLDEPIGERTLLDGTYWPPRPPEPER